MQHIGVILTYDIKKTSASIHTELKDHLKKVYGYSDQILGHDRRWYELPNTTLRKDTVTSSVSAAEFISACKEVGAVWEKYITSEYSMSTFDNQ